MKNLQRESIQILITIQKHFDQRIEILAEERDLPQKLSHLQKKIVDLQEKIKTSSHEKKEKQAHQKNVELELSVVKEKIDRYKEQQMDVKNNKEYDLITKQIDSEKTHYNTLETEAMQAKDVVDTLENKLHGESGMVVTLETLTADYETTKTELSEIQTAHKDQLVQINQSLEELRATLHDQNLPLLESFDYLLERVPNPVVPLKRKSCMGCSTTIPASKHGKILEGSTHTCEECGRIVVNEAFFAEANPVA